ncbi:hypothetical protein FB45DRAFT_389089 [Roridomyces roridus]|uniref:Uncharacterized protein n=1 Tax=Roridomyces roridus TaxID=1738132 RepID=A0AAD7B1U2_9AGAR|nr:hypothetical protein FB45DRAFT_389089 [Roridomyces roridus]
MTERRRSKRSLRVTGDWWLEVARKNIKAAESPITRILEGTFLPTLRSPGRNGTSPWNAGRRIQRDQIHTAAEGASCLTPRNKCSLTHSRLQMERFYHDTNWIRMWVVSSGWARGIWARVGDRNGSTREEWTQAARRSSIDSSRSYITMASLPAVAGSTRSTCCTLRAVLRRGCASTTSDVECEAGGCVGGECE